MPINNQIKRYVGWGPEQGIWCPHGSFWISFLWLYTRVRNHVSYLLLDFWDTSILFFIVAALIYISTNSVGSSLYSRPSPVCVICRGFNDGHSDQCEVVPHYSFNLHLSNNLWRWTCFHVPNEHLYISLEKCLLRYSTLFGRADWVLLLLLLLICISWLPYFAY